MPTLGQVFISKTSSSQNSADSSISFGAAVSPCRGWVGGEDWAIRAKSYRAGTSAVHADHWLWLLQTCPKESWCYPEKRSAGAGPQNPENVSREWPAVSITASWRSSLLGWGEGRGRWNWAGGGEDQVPGGAEVVAATAPISCAFSLAGEANTQAQTQKWAQSQGNPLSKCFKTHRIQYIPFWCRCSFGHRSTIGLGYLSLFCHP